MHLTNLFIWGSGSHAKVLSDAARSTEQFQIAGFVDNTGRHHDLPQAGVLTHLDELRTQIEKHGGRLIIGFGDRLKRRQLISELEAENIEYATVAHASAQMLTGSHVDNGCFVAAGAVVGVDAAAGRHCIINTGASIDHDCQLGENVQVAPGCRLAGHVTVGCDTLIGIGAAVGPGVAVGANCVVGAGAVVISDLPDNVTAVGNPARIVRPEGS